MSLPPPPPQLAPQPLAHVRLFASSDAARAAPLADAAHWHTTFASLFALFEAPQRDAAGHVLRRIDPWTTRLMLRRQMAPALHEQALPEAAIFGQVRAQARALQELRAVGITAAHSRDMPKGSREVAALLSRLGAYEEALEAEHCSDGADAQRHALLRAATEPWPSLFTQVRTLIVEAGTEVLGVRRDLLRALAARGIEVTVHLAYDPQLPAASPWSEAMLHGLEAHSDSRVQVRLGTGGQLGPLAPIRARWAELVAAGEVLPPPLLIPAADTLAARAEELNPGPVEVTAVPAGEEVVAHTVACVHAWLAAGTPPQEIAVILPPMGPGGRDPAALATRLVAGFAAAQIAAQPSAGPRLGGSAAARGLLALLTLAQQVEEGAGDTKPRWHERGIAIDLLAAVMAWAAPPVRVDDIDWPASAQAHLLRRCGARKLGPRGLRQALGSLRSARRGHAEATALAAQAFVDTWVLPLAGGPQPITQRLQHLARLHHEVQTRSLEAAAGAQPSAIDAADHEVDAALADALRLFGRAAKNQPRQTSVAEATGWLQGLFAEVRLPRAEGGPGAVALLSPHEVAGRSFACILSLGVNGGLPPSPADGALAEPVRREINAALGPRLLQYGPVTGRGALPAAARDRFWFAEALRGCRNHWHGVVVLTGDPETDLPHSDAIALLSAAQVPWRAAPPSVAAPPGAQPSMALALRAWAAQQAARPRLQNSTPPPRLAALGRRLSAHLDRGHHPPLGQAVQAALGASILGQVHGASSLDALATCRYRYFAGTLLRLSDERPPDHHLDARRQGDAAHRALFFIYTALAKVGPLAHFRAEPSAAMKLAEETFTAAARAIVEPGQVHPDLIDAALAKVWQAVVYQLGQDLAAATAEPVALEYRFGDAARSDNPALTLTHPHDPARWLQVRGSIDRVDCDGPHLRVIDYKSTLPHRPAHRHLQLGLYQAVALRDLHAQAASTDAAWQLLGRPARGPSVRLPEELQGAPEAIAAQVSQTLWQRMEPLLAGNIAPDSAQKSDCAHCDFLRLCRHTVMGEADDAENDTDADSEVSHAP